MALLFSNPQHFFLKHSLPSQPPRSGCAPLIKEDHCVLMIEPIIQLSILAPGEEKYIELVLKVSSQAI